MVSRRELLALAAATGITSLVPDLPVARGGAAAGAPAPSPLAHAERSPEALLGALARDGLAARLANARRRGRRLDAARYPRRLEHELQVITAAGLAGHFLTSWDIARHAEALNVEVGPGRGSAPGSMVLYALGVTEVDPIEYGLLFERFLNPRRSMVPAIDLDVCARRGGELRSGLGNAAVEREEPDRCRVLGLDALTVTGAALTDINARRDAAGQRALRPADIPLDDPATYAMLADGDTEGVFQLESTDMRTFLRRLAPRSFEDLIAAVALFRPWPLESGLVDDFVDRKHGRRSRPHAHAALEPILAPTHGAVVYQEQVMQIAARVAGYDLAEADLLRRAMGKKQRDVLCAERARFAKRSRAHGVEAACASEIFELCTYFAGSAFSRAHAVAYGMITARMAWLKRRYPRELAAARRALAG